MKRQNFLRSLLVITCLLSGLILHVQAAPVTINVETPGTLTSYISSTKKNQITSLTLTGNLNGTDIRYIREMAGRDYEGDVTSGKLSVLDLSGANIVKGGTNYYYCSIPGWYGGYWSSDNEIGEYMFVDCKQLTSISIPNSVTSIGPFAFSGCSGLTSITIPNSVTSIYERAFSGCSGLTSIIIPKSVTYIDYYMLEGSIFEGCSGLIEILVSTENKDFCSVDGVLFSKNKSLLISYPNSKSNTYNIPNSVTEIGHCAFSTCTGLTSVIIPNSVTQIGYEAFSGCSGLTTVTIPSSITSIGEAAFYDCSGLQSIHNNNALPQTLSGSSAFGQVNLNTCKIYVPIGSYSAYWAAPGWGDFANIIEESVSGKFSINVSGNDKGVISLNETQVNNTTILVNANTAATFRFVPDTGCSLTKVTQDGVDITSSIVNGSYTISSVNKDLIVIATFTEDPVYLTTKDAVSGQFKLVVEKGNQYTYKIEAESGWSINTVTFNGADVTTQLDANKQYTTPAITGNSVLNVSYQNSGTAVSQTLASRLKVYTEGDVIVIEGAEEGLQIAICTESGALIQNFKAANNIIRVTVPQNAVYLIQAGGQTLKVAL